ncbi:mechanosensitive ion channel family protein, partial [Patescibacteria group bacterium]
MANILNINVSELTSTAISWLITSGIKIVLILVAAYIGYKIIHRIMHRGIKQLVLKTYSKGSEIAQQKRIDTLHAIASSALKVILIIIVGLIVLSEFGVNIAPLIAAAGVIGLAIGFGAQYFIRDVISGLFIIIEDQYRKGDVVKIGGVSGLVEDITLRDTVLRDLDGVQHYVPNGEISIASNFTKFWSRAHLNIGVSYDTNLEHAIEVLNRIGKEMAEDEKWKNDIIKPVQVVGVDDFADSAIEIKILGDTKPMRQWDVMRELRKR